MWSAQQHYSCTCQSPRDAREFCREQLLDLLGAAPDAQEVVDSARLIVSELVTNAVNASCSSTDLIISREGDSLRISVVDDAPGQPIVRTATDRDEDGRGLAIVEALASAWGVVFDPRHRKQVWAELTLPPALAS
jgi:anti-sigma regulatory factor (Ser/Thr protein kinase)